MHDDTRLVLARARRTLAETLLPAQVRATAPVEVGAWVVPGEPVPFADAVRQAFTPIRLGTPWGRPWGTTWFRIDGDIPAGWPQAGCEVELAVDLGFDTAAPGFQAEALVFTADGRIVKAIEPRNTHVRLAQRAGEHVELLLEAASNPDLMFGSAPFAPTPLGSLDTAGDAPLYRLERLDLALRDVTVWELCRDVELLLGTIDVLPDDRPRGARLVAALRRMLDALDPDDVAGTATAARAAVAPALASPAVASAHTVVATGHAHIDSAWLWPVRETIRKCARTFSNVLDLMDEDPDVVFAASSAQQYAWMKEHYPELFERIRARVAEGRFVPVGGMWVESDTNMPGGEAMVRQFLYGKRLFREEFGIEPREVWLPDSFGYSAALPQIAVGTGARWFLTQKISWNDTNKMPHHSFLWEGIDGTRIFTHFPPADTYNSDVSPRDLDRAERQFADKGEADTSLLPFGYGDGGGGPTREMMAAARRAADLEGLPRVRVASPRAFFERAEAEYESPPVWAGELYLELHRGTYTSQARTKRGNRRNEHLLHEAELWSATATVRTGAAYPYEALDESWRTVLLQQFHDILPGSSIAWVHREAERNHARVQAELEALVADRLTVLAGSGTTPLVAHAGGGSAAGDVPPLAIAPAPAVPAARSWTETGEHVLDNGVVRAAFTATGLVRSLVELASGREVVPAGMPAGLLQLHRDVPARWDAWDVDEDYRRVRTDLADADAVELVDGPLGPTVRVTRSFGASRVVQRMALVPGSAALDVAVEVDWHERQKLLKLSFPTTVHTDRFAAETQFGHVFRSTRANTSWDAARFEVCAHRWVHAAEPGFGVGVANDGTYGHDVTSTRSEDGGPATVIRLSLLRAPLFPDPDADQGTHSFAFRLVLADDVRPLIAAGHALNLPPRSISGERAVEPLVRVDDDGVVIETVKLADDRSGDVVVRLYESTGATRPVRVTAGFPFTRVRATDLLERPGPDAIEHDGTTVRALLGPFRILTLRYERDDAGGS